MKLLRKIKKSALKGKTVLLRIDLNVEPGAPLDSYRLEAVMPTIRLLRKNGARVVLMSHRGRPMANSLPTGDLPKGDKGQMANKNALSLKSFVPILSKKLKEKVVFLPDLDLQAAKRAIETSKESLFLLENLRFWTGEEKNDRRFAKELVALGDIYVNDAFAVSHRANASVAAITRFVLSYAGLLLEREIEHLSRIMKRPGHPFTLVVGGAKISDKVGMVEYFWREADAVLLGGGPANTFFAAEGIPMGDSLVDASSFPFVKKYKDKGKIILPVDSEIAVLSGGDKVLDIGEVTARWFADIIAGSKTVVWNGPMGLFERKGFEKGTVAIWKAILALAKRNHRARIVVGGGETVDSLGLVANSKGQIAKGKNLFLSTGGGAMLEFLSGKKLPGIAALEGVPRRRREALK